MNNFTNFLNHLNSFPKNKNQLNELNTSGRYWTPDGPGPDRVSSSNPPAIFSLMQPDTSDGIQKHLREAILSHKHEPFAEQYKERYDNLSQVEKINFIGAYNTAGSTDANEHTLLLAASHNDPNIRDAARNNPNATDNVKGMALWHDTILKQTEADLKKQGLKPVDLHNKYSTHPQIHQHIKVIKDRMRDLRSHLSTAINNGHNLLEMHEQFLRGEDPEREERERRSGPYNTPDRMN